jgi:hypothetical protein
VAKLSRRLSFAKSLCPKLKGVFPVWITNRVNVSDLNTVCECDLPAASFSTANFPGTIASLNPLFGFDTPRQTLNPFQFQYGFKLSF